MSILKYFRQHHVNHTLHEQGRNKTLRDFPLSSFGLDLKACFQNGLVSPAMISENFDYQWVNYCLSLDCVSVSNQTIRKGSWSTYKDREPGLHRVYRTSYVNCFYAHVCVGVVSQSVACDFLWPHDCSPQAPLSMEFSRQKYWSGLPFPTPKDLPEPGLNLHLLCLLHWQADSFPLCYLGDPCLLINVC